MEPLHMREETWKGQPFGAVEEVADLIEEFVELVFKAASQGIESLVVTIQYPDKHYPRMPLADLRELAPALQLDGADFFVVVKPAGQPRPVGIEFNCFNGAHRPSARLGVDGQNEIAVNGVFIAAKERIDKLFERKRNAEELAAAAEAEEAEAAKPAPALRRFVNNQWTVQIGSGVILFGLGLLIGSR
jgi:hypothetical protein